MSMFTVVTVRGQSCPSYEIGYNDEITDATVGPLESAHVYINIADPVQCSGRVYAWHLCPFLESDTEQSGLEGDDVQSGSFELVLAMYRLQNDNLIIVKKSYHELSVENFDGDCLYVPLESSEWFDVNEGDMVAACWYDEEEEEVEEGNDIRIELAVHRDDKDIAEFEHDFVQSCSKSQIQLLHDDALDTIDDQTLLLTAYISKALMFIFVLVLTNCNVFLRHK